MLPNHTKSLSFSDFFYGLSISTQLIPQGFGKFPPSRVLSSKWLAPEAPAGRPCGPWAGGNGDGTKARFLNENRHGFPVKMMEQMLFDISG